MLQKIYPNTKVILIYRYVSVLAALAKALSDLILFHFYQSSFLLPNML